ncbi:MAG: CPBP family intramembrane metalloprotease [Ktedonobacteraceae bacterium]|nr:CPBP family intramembrane metalloprotease [Ktedonobacteraceae bacterium]
MKLSIKTLGPWLSLAALFGSQLVALVILVALWIFFPRARSSVGTPFGTFSVSVLGGFAALSAVLLFPDSRRDLFLLFKLQSIRRGFSYFAPSAGFVLGVVGVSLTRVRVEHFAEDYPLMKPFIHLAGPQKYLLAILLLVGPIFEEVIMRGFLYRAFRRSYGITLSVSTIVLTAMLTHLGAVTTSPWLFLLIGALQTILCLILEKTCNLWNCIACHFVYNAVVASAWLMQTNS